MEKVPADTLRLAKETLDILIDDVCLKTIASRLVKGLKKTPQNWEMLNESAIVLMQSLPAKPKDHNKFDIEGK